MKKIFTFFALGLFALSAQAQDAPKPAAEELLHFREVEHDFGKIPQGKPVYYSFEVTNTSGEEIKIDNVQTSCGCTTPEWNREPIAPGATAVIKVGYNAAAVSPFTKYITVLYNGKQTQQLIIKGEVWKAPDGSAPLNASVQLLKQKNK